ncbi:MAG: hypothetical protein ABI411_20820 [Tahibacter sp.]
MKATSTRVLVGFIALTSCAVQARDRRDGTLTTESIKNFSEQAAQVRDQLQPGGRYEFTYPAEREKVEQGLQEIQRLLSAVENPESLSDKDKVDLMVAQESVNAILTERDGNRLICEQVSPTGSHRKIQQCGTYADRMRMRKDTWHYFHDVNTRMLTKSN